MNKSTWAFLATVLLGIAQSVHATEIPIGPPLTEDTPLFTSKGNPFVAPAHWLIAVQGAATFIEAPEGDSRLVLVDVEAKDADAALAKGWAIYKEISWPLKVSNDQPDQDGWTRRRRYEYQTSPDEKRSVSAGVMLANEIWTVWIYDMANEVGGKRSAQTNLVFSSLLPKGYSRETFAGLKPHRLDTARLAELTGYIERALKTTGVPGVGLGIVQDGEVVFASGLGVRTLGKPEKIDAKTLFLIASNTKAMTTLLLARQVDTGKLTWKTPVTNLMPGFKLGSDATTSRVLVEHLVCACTGLPRKDMEMVLEFGNLNASDVIARLSKTEPTSAFGEMFQYSNDLAAAAGYVGGYVAYPELELGASYDKAMQTEVFSPLNMDATTFDFEHALAINHAEAHGITVDGQSALASIDINLFAVHVRPAGAAWSNVNDMLKYIMMELDEGVLPNGERYISKEALLERRVAKVPVSQNAAYGMGLVVDETYGTQVVHHGGDVIGHHSDMMWLPEHDVGAVVLTNGDPGWLIRTGFRRKLLEVLFDGKSEADAALISDSKRYFEQVAANRKLYTVPADMSVARKLATQYVNDSLGKIAVSRNDGMTVFDFGEWRSEVASKENPDGTISFITIAPGIAGLEFVVGSGDKHVLIMRDAQHEYVFEAI